MKRKKLFEIDKQLVYEAYKAARSNKDNTGIDGIGISSYEEENMSSNLY